MSQIISNFSFQLHLQHRGKGMGLQILRPNPQCPRDAAPRQRAGIGKMKLLASVHVALAFLATVLFYLAITSLDLKLYFQYPGHFSLCTGLLGFAIAATAALLVLSGFMISSALEFFLTVFAGLWLWLFCRRIRILKRHWL